VKQRRLQVCNQAFCFDFNRHEKRASRVDSEMLRRVFSKLACLAIAMLTQYRPVCHQNPTPEAR